MRCCGRSCADWQCSRRHAMTQAWVSRLTLPMSVAAHRLLCTLLAPCGSWGGGVRCVARVSVVFPFRHLALAPSWPPLLSMPPHGYGRQLVVATIVGAMWRLFAVCLARIEAVGWVCTCAVRMSACVAVLAHGVASIVAPPGAIWFQGRRRAYRPLLSILLVWARKVPLSARLHFAWWAAATGLALGAALLEFVCHGALVAEPAQLCRRSWQHFRAAALCVLLCWGRPHNFKPCLGPAQGAGAASQPAGGQG